MDCSPSVFGLCDKAHYHNYRFSDVLSSSLPETMQANQFDETYVTSVPINCQLRFIKDCPCDLPGPNPVTGSGDQSELISDKMIKVLEEKLFNSIEKKQNELLNNFKKETDNIIKTFKDLHQELRWEVHSVTMSITTHRSQMQKFSEQVEELECKIQELLPQLQSCDDNSDESINEFEESEDILQEIEVIKQSDRIFMEYRPLTGQHWEVDKPVVFQVTICDTILNAIYDPRVSKSIMSDDILLDDNETVELDYDKVFYVPWWFPKLQTCRDEGTVDILINTHYWHSNLNVALNPLWNRTVVLGFNFGQKFIHNVNEDNGTITLKDDSESLYCLNFEYYE